MVQDREDQLNRNGNEAKLNQVQQRFPNDILKLSEPLEASELRLYISLLILTCSGVNA